MSVFIDTSAFYALLDRTDSRHEEARRIWDRLLDSSGTLFTHNYVIVETAALVQRRLGIKAALAFFEDILAVVEVHWIDENLHRRAAGAFRAAGRKALSFVDCASFETMEALGLKAAFAFDRDFKSRGYHVLPGQG